MFSRLPDRLRELVERPARLQERVQLLDQQLDGRAPADRGPGNPLESQMEMLRQAFGGRR